MKSEFSSVVLCIVWQLVAPLITCQVKSGMRIVEFSEGSLHPNETMNSDQTDAHADADSAERTVRRLVIMKSMSED